MRSPSFTLVAAAAAALLPVSLAQLDANAIVQALNSAGLTSLAQAAVSVNNTPTGSALFSTLLSGQNVTVFAPTDNAFTNAQSRLANAQPADVANILSYHVLVGNFSSPDSAGSLVSSESPNVTIARTQLNASDLVQLEGNKSQVVAWTRENNRVRILNQKYVYTLFPWVTGLRFFL
ncbi:hypothetical protein K435DRAFT_661389 [Dendrothele bispora CBS 962.96]|uniref:FAS1 domain-containing protein n=1 Tax=Dendrothele bispora (strain CBS 962.96) TaxID=1314807 RepID=A0A4S8M7D1_DENBC|nr:hypothetical protein K435DRAFT_661389 [Dendrothele bispora CBS 962.96]